MQMTRIILAMIFILAAFSGTSFTATKEGLSNSKNSLERAKELWEAAITAKGGRDRLYAVNSLAISEDINKNNRLSSSLYVFPDKYWDWSDKRPYKFGLQVLVENHELGVGYFVVGHEPDNPSKIKLSPEHRSKFDDVQLTLLLESKWFKPELLGASKNRIGPKQVVRVLRAQFSGKTNGRPPRITRGGLCQKHGRRYQRAGKHQRKN